MNLKDYKYNDGSTLADVIHQADHADVVDVWTLGDEQPMETFGVKFADGEIKTY